MARSPDGRRRSSRSRVPPLWLPAARGLLADEGSGALGLLSLPRPTRPRGHRWPGRSGAAGPSRARVSSSVTPAGSWSAARRAELGVPTAARDDAPGGEGTVSELSLLSAREIVVRETRLRGMFDVISGARRELESSGGPIAVGDVSLVAARPGGLRSWGCRAKTTTPGFRNRPLRSRSATPNEAGRLLARRHRSGADDGHRRLACQKLDERDFGFSCTAATKSRVLAAGRVVVETSVVKERRRACRGRVTTSRGPSTAKPGPGGCHAGRRVPLGAPAPRLAAGRVRWCARAAGRTLQRTGGNAAVARALAARAAERAPAPRAQAG